MEELPEAEVLRRDLERDYAGRKVKSVDVADASVVSRQKNLKDYLGRLEGIKVRSFERRGTIILAKLESEEYWVLMPGRSGRVRRAKPETSPIEGEKVKASFAFTQGVGLALVDRLSSSESCVLAKEELAGFAPYRDLGLDPLENPLPWQRFGQMLLKQQAKLKTILTDEKVIAGVGSVYSDEILFHAGLRYDRVAESLSAHEVRRLYRAIVETLSKSVRARGLSIEPWQLDMYDKPGEFAAELAVYERTGKNCLRCRAHVERIKFQKRAVFYCPGCQS